MKPGPMWGKKDKNCDPAQAADNQRGSWWDHVILDTKSRLIVSLVVGRRTSETLVSAWADFYHRTDGGLPELVTTDEYAAYPTALLETYGVRKEDLELSVSQKKELDYASMPAVYFPEEINHATVRKQREGGRVVKIEQRIVRGTKKAVDAALKRGSTASTINVSYVERCHGTQRHFNARKARKVYTFSKELVFHVALTWLCVVYYNFGWTLRTLRQRVQTKPPRYQHRTPAMVAGLTDHQWTLNEIFTRPLFPPKPSAQTKKPQSTAKEPEGG
jgi:IS1 family transposase